MTLEDEYRDLIHTLKLSPEYVQTLTKILDLKKQKLLLSVENSDNKDEVWNIKIKLSVLNEIKKEIITHSND